MVNAPRPSAVGLVAPPAPPPQTASSLLANYLLRGSGDGASGGLRVGSGALGGTTVDIHILVSSVVTPPGGGSAAGGGGGGLGALAALIAASRGGGTGGSMASALSEVSESAAAAASARAPATTASEVYEDRAIGESFVGEENSQDGGGEEQEHEDTEGGEGLELNDDSEAGRDVREESENRFSEPFPGNSTVPPFASLYEEHESRGYLGGEGESTGAVTAAARGSNETNEGRDAYEGGKESKVGAEEEEGDGGAATAKVDAPDAAASAGTKKKTTSNLLGKFLKSTLGRRSSGGGR